MALQDEMGIPGWAAPAHETPGWAAPATSVQAMPGAIGGGRVSPRPISPAYGYASALQGGLAAGQASGAGGAFDTTEAAFSMGGATLSGAAAGALAGSMVPGVGTAIGAGVGAMGGLLTSGVSAWMSIRARRRRRRELEAIKKEILEREAAEKLERDQANAYQAGIYNLNGAAAAYDKNAVALQRMMTSNKNLLRLYVQDGI